MSDDESTPPPDLQPFSSVGNPKLPRFTQMCFRRGLTEIRDRTINIWLNEQLEKGRSHSANEINEQYADLVKQVHVDYYARIGKLIKQEFRKGNNEYTAFNRICRLMTYNEVPREVLHDWFSLFYECKPSGSKVHADYRKLIEMILEDFTLFKHAYYKKDTERQRVFGFVKYNSRYDFCFDTSESDKRKLVITDLYHQQSKNLPLTHSQKALDIVTNKGSYCNILQTFNNSMLIENRVNSLDDPHTRLFLIEFDTKVNTCQINEQYKEIDWFIHNFILDECNQERFVIYGYSTTTSLFLTVGGRVEDNHLTIETRESSQADQWQCQRLIGDTIYGLFFDDENPKISYNSLNLDIGASQREFETDFDYVILESTLSTATHYAWHMDNCYFQVQPSTCHLLNTANQTCTKLDLLSLGFTYYPEMIDENGNLVAISDSGISYFQLRKPEKLERIVWFEIRRSTLFFETKQYEQAMKKLSLSSELQPFHGFE